MLYRSSCNYNAYWDGADGGMAVLSWGQASKTGEQLQETDPACTLTPPYKYRE